MLKNYLDYLIFLNNKLHQFFDAQKPYIKCARGCAKCCQDGEYPFSKMEFDFLMLGFTKLPPETQSQILENVAKIKAEKAASNEEKFMYQCPFLINNECSVYNYRGIICRSFGLMTHYEETSPRIPFCAYQGLNYAEVFDTETNKISMEKFKALNIDTEPLAYNVRYEFLTDDDFGKSYGFEFGEKRPLIDWFVERGE